MRSVLTSFALLLALALGAADSPVLAHRSATREGGSQTGASRVSLAVVTDPRNRPIVDIGADDFVIQEAGAAREVLSVRLADYPIVILFDTSAGARDDVATIRKAVERFIDRIGDRPVAVGTFGDTPVMIATFEDDRSALWPKLDAAIANPHGQSVLTRGAALGGQTIRAVQPLFSAIVIVSAAPLDEMPDTSEEVLAPIIDSGAVVHVIANRAGTGAGAAAQAVAAIRSLAEQTHGDFTSIYTAASYQSALDRLADRLSTELMIEYLVPNGSKPNDVKVGVRIPGARVRGLGVAPR
jgi:uncharacterized protein (DUF779 family)